MLCLVSPSLFPRSLALSLSVLLSLSLSQVSYVRLFEFRSPTISGVFCLCRAIRNGCLSVLSFGCVQDSKIASLERNIRDLEDEIQMLKTNGLLNTEDREEEIKQMEVYKNHSKFMKSKVLLSCHNSPTLIHIDSMVSEPQGKAPAAASLQILCMLKSKSALLSHDIVNASVRFAFISKDMSRQLPCWTAKATCACVCQHRREHAVDKEGSPQVFISTTKQQ